VSTREARTGWPVRERSALPTVLGIPPLAAVGVAAALTALGLVIDVLRIGGVGIVFSIAYVLGCVLAVGWVRRRNLFAPMVQPPLLLLVLIPAVVLLLGRPAPGLAETALLIGAPLVNAFPSMAIATAATLLIGLGRIAVQRVDVEEDERLSGRRGGDAARGAGRTSGSPRRS